MWGSYSITTVEFRLRREHLESCDVLSKYIAVAIRMWYQCAATQAFQEK